VTGTLDMVSLPFPSDITAEARILGALLYDGERHAPLLPAALTQESFFSSGHGHVFAAIQRALADGFISRTITETSLRQNDRLKSLEGGAHYLYRLEAETSVMTAVEFGLVCQTVLEYAARRRALQAVKTHAIQFAVPSTGLVSEQIGSLERELGAISLELHAQRGMTSLRDALRVEIKSWHDMQSAKKSAGTSSGFAAYDSMTSGGFYRGDLVVLAARPGAGKTALAMAFAANVATHGNDVAVFSLEMPTSQLAGRLLAAKAGVSLSKAKTGRLERDDMTAMTWAGSELKELHMHIDDCSRGRPTVKDICAKARRVASEAARLGRRLDMIVVDYIQIVKLDPALQRQRHDLAVGEVSTELKSLAKELDTTVIGIAQLNRGVESRTDKRPMMSDLRDSGQLEQDADLILMLYRDRYYHPQATGPDIVEMIFSKNRHGAPGRTQLEFIGQSMQFVESAP